MADSLIHAERRRRMFIAIDHLASAISGVNEVASKPGILDPEPLLSWDLPLDGVLTDLASAMQHVILAVGEPPEFAPLMTALGAFQDGSDQPDTAEEAASGSPVVQSHRTPKEDPNMLNPSSFSKINTVLLAVVNAGGVRPEDQATVNEILAELKADEESYSGSIASLTSSVEDHETRLVALEEGVNGEADALDPPPPADPSAAGSTTTTSNVETSVGGAGTDTTTLTGAGDTTSSAVETSAAGEGSDTTTLTSTATPGVLA